MFYKCKKSSVDYMHNIQLNVVLSVLDEQTFDHGVIKEWSVTVNIFANYKNA